MIAAKDKIDNISNLLHFHQHEHEALTVFLIKKLPQTMDFKLKIQKASIQLVNAEPFAVIGFRRSQKSIFLEFYNKSEIKHDRIIKTTASKNKLIINRVTIAAIDEIDAEIINWV
ncbi:MAG: hypothetical protein GY754_07710 [bacterium]|nr:hypothetical protein [bacterium]